ncbi:hypothetical protein SDC9_179309 [bioreactor metagenome]|uniref:Uncharacterized protein n=1 Tax=bioreactor metagenome TaxID=1076179 RepID=A0A645H6E1_9ZZZZ
MGEGHAGSVRIGFHFGDEGREQRLGLLDKQAEGLFQTKCIHVVQDVHAGCSQVDDGGSGRALLCIRLDLGHQVMMDFRFNGHCTVNVYRFLVGFQLSKLLLGDQASLHLGRSKSYPDTSEQSSFVCLTKKKAHRLTAIAPGKG